MLCYLNHPNKYITRHKCKVRQTIECGTLNKYGRLLVSRILDSVHAMIANVPACTSGPNARYHSAASLERNVMGLTHDSHRVTL